MIAFNLQLEVPSGSRSSYLYQEGAALMKRLLGVRNMQALPKHQLAKAHSQHVDCGCEVSFSGALAPQEVAEECAFDWRFATRTSRVKRWVALRIDGSELPVLVIARSSTSKPFWRAPSMI